MRKNDLIYCAVFLALAGLSFFLFYHDLNATLSNASGTLPHA
jgi:hypothetical protein